MIHDSDFPPLRPGQSQAYGRVSKQLYLPVESALSFDPADSEWQILLNHDTAAYVWHPHLKLVAFDSTEMLCVGDLIARPEFSPTSEPSASLTRQNWGHAQTGVLFSNKITSLRADLPPSFESMLVDGRDDIGTQAKPLPPGGLLPGSIKTVGSIAAAGIIAPFALLGGLINLVSSPFNRTNTTGRPAPGRGSSFQKFFDWLRSKFSGNQQQPPQPRPASQGPASANGASLIAVAMAGLGQLMHWTAELLDARKRELHRLMKLLEEDPDEGLKYALPMGGEPGRGASVPSASLLARMVDFSLSRPGGGGPADVWDLPPQLQLVLTNRYRELAAREIQLGRYRRAAYIFAELLGDVNAAAHALVSGRFYREAAVLYRDKLKQPLEAANCLEKGGLLQEAIPLFRQVGQLEKVGDLYHRLQEFERAETAFREAVEQSRLRKDFLDAARILEQKVESEQEALLTLDAGWPDSTQARRCLESAFEMRGRLGRHDAALQVISELLKAELPGQRRLDAIEVLAKVAVESPHAATRSAAGDAVRIRVSQALAEGAANRQQLTAAISRLAPEDRLLSRDCHRATLRTGQQRNSRNRPQTETPAASKPARHAVKLLRTFQLPPGVNWTAACDSDACFYVAGWHDGRIAHLARGTWNDPHATVNHVESDPHAYMPWGLLLSHDPAERTIIVASPAGRVFALKNLPPTDAYPLSELVRTPTWVPTSVSAMARAASGSFYTFQLMDMELTSWPAQRDPTFREKLPSRKLDQTFDPHQVCPMVAQENACFLAIDNFLYEARFGSEIREQHYSQPVRRLAISPPHTDRRLAVLFDRGGYVYRSENDLNNYRWFAEDLDSPHAVFLRDGRLIVLGEAAHQRVWRVYTTSNDAVRMLFEIPCDIEGEVLTLLRAGAPQQVGLVTTDGKVLVLELQ